MSDKVELIAAAQVVVSAGPPGSVSFNSNFGFKDEATYALGVYGLELKHEHGPEKLVVHVTKNSGAGSNVNIEASVLNDRHIQVNNFDSSDTPADASFFISVLRVRD